MAPRAKKATYDAPAVRLAVRLVELLADRGAPTGVSEAARALGTNKNMAYRLLATLAREGWVTADPAGAGYTLTLRPFRAAARVVNRLDLVAAAEGPMRELRDAIDEYVYLGVLRDDRVLFVRDLRPRAKPVQVAGGVGYDYPLHDNAPGKALLAWGGEPLLARVLRRGLRPTTPRTIVAPDALRRHLAEARRRGFATDLEENIPGVICLAVPVFDRDGAVAGTVGITTLTAFHSVAELTGTLGPRVVRTGRRISETLGHADGPGAAPESRTR
jgi:DNA-binding IclR family transcriptional regulator